MVNNIRKWDEVNGADESSGRMAAFLDSAANSYAILQLRRSDETAYERFESYVNLKRQGKEPNIDHYEIVYVGILLASLTPEAFPRLLEELYVKFNVNRPSNFTSHSLSVSDIVALKVGNVVSFHYVDTIGFQELPDFLGKYNYLRSAEMAMEDDYNMIDGIAGNNGSKEEQPVQKSVLDGLKKKSAAKPATLHKKKPEEWEL